MKRILAFALLLCIISIPAISATAPPATMALPTTEPIPNEVLKKKIASLKVKDIQRMTGRKLTLKEKIAWGVLKKKLKRSSNQTGKGGKTALIFGVVGLGLFVIGLFVPFVILGALVASIIAIVTGSSAIRKDPSDRNAHSGKLLGWITLALVVLVFLLAVALAASWGWI